MEFRFLVFLLLVGVAFADEHGECEETEVKKCVTGFEELSKKGLSPPVACRAARAFLKCVRYGLNRCGSDDVNGEYFEHFQGLESIYQSKCGDIRMNENDNECLKNNEDYLKACLQETIGDMTVLMFERQEMDENTVQCLTFLRARNCVVERISEKCGEETGAKFDEENSRNVPVEVHDACTAESTLAYLAENMLENRRKRR